jgi:hypothetical protein
MFIIKYLLIDVNSNKNIFLNDVINIETKIFQGFGKRGVILSELVAIKAMR